jgi:hypothetical protein
MPLRRDGRPRHRVCDRSVERKTANRALDNAGRFGQSARVSRQPVVTGEPLLTYRLDPELIQRNRVLLIAVTALGVVWSIAVVRFWWFLIPVVAIAIGLIWRSHIRMRSSVILVYPDVLVFDGLFRRWQIPRCDIKRFIVSRESSRMFLTFEVQLTDYSFHHLVILEPDRGRPLRGDIDQILRDLNQWLREGEAFRSTHADGIQ